MSSGDDSPSRLTRSTSDSAVSGIRSPLGEFGRSVSSAFQRGARRVTDSFGSALSPAASLPPSYSRLPSESSPSRRSRSASVTVRRGGSRRYEEDPAETSFSGLDTAGGELPPPDLGDPTASDPATPVRGFSLGSSRSVLLETPPPSPPSSDSSGSPRPPSPRPPAPAPVGPSMSVPTNIGSLSIKVLNSEAAYAPTKLYSKKNRQTLDASDLSVLFTAATKSIPQNLKFASTPLDIENPKQLTTIAGMDSSIRAIKERMETYDFVDVFQVVEVNAAGDLGSGFCSVRL